MTNEPDLTAMVAQLEREERAFFRERTDRPYYVESATPYQVTTKLSSGKTIPFDGTYRTVENEKGKVLAEVPYVG